MRQERLFTPQRFDIPRGRSTAHQVSDVSTRGYSDKASRSEPFPKLTSLRGGPSSRSSSSTRGGRPPVPDINRIAVPRLPQPRRGTSNSPTRQLRDRSPSKASKEAREYEESIEAGDIVDPDNETRGPLKQRSGNAVTCTAIQTANNKKRVVETGMNSGEKGKENEAI